MKQKKFWVWKIIIFGFTLIILMGAFDLYEIDQFLYQFFTFNSKQLYYDLPFWDSFAAVGTIAAALAAFITIKFVQKQIKEDQEPYLVLLNRKIYVPLFNNFEMSIKCKNIGRGPAIRVTASFDIRGQERALFEDEEPHSKSFSAGGGDAQSRLINSENFLIQLYEQVFGKPPKKFH